MSNFTTVVKIGYKQFAFKNSDDALNFYRLLSTSIPLESTYGKLPDGRDGIDFILNKDMDISLCNVPFSKIEANFTKDELQKKVDAKNDVDGTVEIVSIEAAPAEIEFF